MPVTAKLSRKFYGRLGDDIANELVDWFNAVDDTYRTQLRDLNELNWNRFQAAMDARFAAAGRTMDQRFTDVDARFAEFELKMEHGFTALKEAFDAKLDQRFGAVDARFTAMDDRFAASDLKMEQRFAAMHVAIERRYGDHTKSLVGLWLATVIPLGGLIVGLFNSIR